MSNITNNKPPRFEKDPLFEFSENVNTMNTLTRNIVQIGREGPRRALTIGLDHHTRKVKETVETVKETVDPLMQTIRNSCCCYGTRKSERSDPPPSTPDEEASTPILEDCETQ